MNSISIIREYNLPTSGLPFSIFLFFFFFFFAELQNSQQQDALLLKGVHLK